MNEEELKKIWKTDQTAPGVDFVGLQKLLNVWQDKLRRKIRIDIGAQIASLAVVLIIVWFYPKLFFMFWFGVILAVWYIREILRFYQQEKEHEDYGSVKQFLSGKILTMKSFIRRTRLVLYAIPFILIPAAHYALGYFNDASLTVRDWIIALTVPLVISEIISVILTEIYFKIFYSSAVNELKDLLRQLDSDK